MLAQMVFHNLGGQAGHRAARGGELAQDLAARPFGLKRALDPLDLALETTNAGDELLFVADGVGHGDDYPQLHIV